MAELSLQDRQRRALQLLLELAQERARSEEEHERGHERRLTASKREYRETCHQIRTRYETDKEATATEFHQAQQSITARFEEEHTTTDRNYRRVKHDLDTAYEENQEKAETSYQEARWAATAELEARKKAIETQRERMDYRLKQTREKLQELERDSQALIARWGPLREILKLQLPPQKPVPKSSPGLRLKRHVLTAKQRLEQMQRLRLPHWFRGQWLSAVFVLLWLAGIAPLLLLDMWYYLVPGWSLAVLAAYFICRSLLYRRARSQALRLYRTFRIALVHAEFTIEELHRLAEARCKRQLSEATRRCHRGLQRADRHYQLLVARLKQRYESDSTHADAKFGPMLERIERERDHDWQAAEENYHSRNQEIDSRFETDSIESERDHHTLLQGLERRREEEWLRLSMRWQVGIADILREWQEVDEECARRFPPWDASAWTPERLAELRSCTKVPRGMRFGDVTIALADVPQGVPKIAELRDMVPPQFALPALLSFPTRAGVLYKASGEGRAAAVLNLQALMMRFLTSLPPGKVRFTIIDPVGLGENFAAFMHLADHDEDLVTSRIWTESQQIEQRLTDLTDHMGDVIQKYLRNQYASIEDYNEQAGEVAEPYRVLVVANFPTNFSIDAARRLISIASTGNNCGVYTLISVDTSQELPEGFNLADLEQVSLNLEWKDHHFEWQDADFGNYPLVLELPPENELATQLLHDVGAKAKEAKRVEVRFEFVAPRPEDWWTQESTTGIRVPLGRAGATRRQVLELGHGTSQHVLIAGKTGSGKSSLLHALITNLALLYSPEEIELYLIDFKKGVEFKAYAVHHLPHARVVAIESEREFGLSVLQRLDGELKSRGEAFRKLGVNDLNAYRHATGTACPRILLIVDEFQEFFVEDDKLAQEAALLLDRLVRQGRAFGLHVLLGSQTLGGAYTLARSTIDQMAVRIALQCSEADAHLILSKENSAARLLSRPGEAIYNDANGMVEGNDLFQIVWLPDDRRDSYLHRLHELATRRHATNGRRQIIFEGNAPAEPQKNPLLQKLLGETSWQAAPRAAAAWLGEAIAIKDPTAATFRPQTASNLLVLGQHEEAAVGVFAAALISLATQHSPIDEGEPAFQVLDGTPVDSPHAGWLERVASHLPHRIKVSGWRDVPEVINELAATVARREQERATDAPRRFLIIQGLQWFRDLRRQEEEFGYSRRGEDKVVAPAKQLLTILRDGPGVGVHVLVWCDTLANLQRSLDRQGLREFEMRVLFQMSAADSSNLIDSPLASRLGLHRALFISEEKSAPEKFRPYGLPTAEWLEQVRQALEKKAAVGVVS